MHPQPILFSEVRCLEPDQCVLLPCKLNQFCFRGPHITPFFYLIDVGDSSGLVSAVTCFTALLDCRFSFDFWGPFGALWGLFRWIFEKGSFGKCETLKMVNLPGAPPPSNLTPLTPPTIRLWVIRTHTYTYTHTDKHTNSLSHTHTHTHAHEQRGEQACVMERVRASA